MNGIFKRIGGYLFAVLMTIMIGVILQTQNVLSRLSDVGADISLMERVSMTLYDLRYLGSLYGIFIAIALAVAFLVAGGVFKLTKFGRTVIYTFAGAAAMLVMLFAMKAAFFDVHLIAGARDSFGIGLQMLAGALGGVVFTRLSTDRTKF